MKFSYCTLFDKNYLPQLLSLCDSLDNYVTNYKIYCFCMDSESYDYLKQINNRKVIPISERQLESHYPELITAKSNRSRIEYYFTCSPATCSYIFDFYESTELITYLDADLYFFSSPIPIYHELQNSSIGIIEHRFSLFGKKHIKYGRFNVGWVSFRNDLSGRQCLEDWRKNCLLWCYDRIENGKFADQKYLDYWPNNYTGVQIIKHLGANLAPWNVGRYHLKTDSNTKKIFVNNQQLIFYHFASFKQIDLSTYNTNLSKYFVILSGVIRNDVYLTYLKSIKKYNDILHIKFNLRNRDEYINSNLRYKFKLLFRNFLQFICHDYINLKHLT